MTKILKPKLKKKKIDYKVVQYFRQTLQAGRVHR